MFCPCSRKTRTNERHVLQLEPVAAGHHLEGSWKTLGTSLVGFLSSALMNSVVYMVLMHVMLHVTCMPLCISFARYCPLLRRFLLIICLCHLGCVVCAIVLIEV
jgi:hypothetical protein